MENLDIGALLKKRLRRERSEFTEKNFKYKPAFKTYFLLTVQRDDCFTFRSCQM